tara:strand:- start:269 stop:394 length:126 start_codon:yes stop_codon:yes gene_type:complete
MRFPELKRGLFHRGVEIVTVPAGFKKVLAGPLGDFAASSSD